jgi:hypothetical protein
VLSAPPLGPRPAPQVTSIAAGTILWRLHTDAFRPNEFNPTVPVPFAGGRFDCTDGSFSYLYAASDTIAAVAETLLRDRPLRGHHFVLAKKLTGRRLSKLILQRQMHVVKLHGSGLTAVRQTAELTSSGPDDYTATRAWATALRSDARAANGFEWRPRHDNDRLAYIFFGDRCDIRDLSPGPSYSLTESRGRYLVQRALARHGATLA